MDRLKPAYIEETGEAQQLPEEDTVPIPSENNAERGHSVRKIKFAIPRTKPLKGE